MEVKKGVLRLQIFEGRNLAAKDIGGSSDPYCVAALLDVRGEAADAKLPQHRTPVIKKTLFPVWKDQVFEFKPVQEGHIRTLLIHTWDEDLLNDDFMGEIRINPNDLPDGFLVDTWYPLKSRPGKRDDVKGELHLSLMYKKFDTVVEQETKKVGGQEKVVVPERKKGAPLAVQDSNIANLGTDLEKKVKLAAAKTEAAWQHAGQKPGLEIWRIENFAVKAWPQNQYGKFYNGDSYIVLNTYKKHERTDALAWDIHFWLGTFTSQDEAGTAAYKTVELDDFLGGDPVQHREVQEHESELFLTYFKSTVQYLEGGVDSGFKHVGPKEYKPRLYHVKGKKNVRMVQVPINRSSLNSGDVFILDAGLNIYQWQGKSSGPTERMKAGQVCRTIDDERGGLPQVIVMDEGYSDDGSDCKEFWSLLGGKGDIAPAAAGGDDLEYEKKSSLDRRLFRLSDQSGKMEFIEVAQGRVTRRMLSSADVFIFDTGAHVYAWIGKGSSVEEKNKSMKYAQEYLTKYNRPVYLPISRILEGGENKLFEQSFDAN